MSDTRATSNPHTHDPGTNDRITGSAESRAAEEMAKLGPFLFAKKYGISVPDAVALEKYLRPKPIVLSSRSQRTPPVVRPFSEEERKRAAVAEAAAKVRAEYAQKSRAVPLYGALAFGVHDMPDEDAILQNQLAESAGEFGQLVTGVDLRSAGRSPSRTPRGRSAWSPPAAPRGSWTTVKRWTPEARAVHREELAVVREKTQGKDYRVYKQRYNAMKEKGKDPEQFLHFEKEEILAQVNIGVLEVERRILRPLTAWLDSVRVSVPKPTCGITTKT